MQRLSCHRSEWIYSVRGALSAVISAAAKVLNTLIEQHWQLSYWCFSSATFDRTLTIKNTALQAFLWGRKGLLCSDINDFSALKEGNREGIGFFVQRQFAEPFRAQKCSSTWPLDGDFQAVGEFFCIIQVNVLSVDICARKHPFRPPINFLTHSLCIRRQPRSCLAYAYRLVSLLRLRFDASTCVTAKLCPTRKYCTSPDKLIFPTASFRQHPTLHNLLQLFSFLRSFSISTMFQCSEGDLFAWIYKLSLEPSTSTQHWSKRKGIS